MAPPFPETEKPDATPRSQKRRHDATTPQRHHSADSPLSARVQHRRDHADGPNGNDIIMWQTMSPSGTLKRVLRRRVYSEQRDILVNDRSRGSSITNNSNSIGGSGGDDSSLARGIIQQILESRNTSALQPVNTSSAAALTTPAKAAGSTEEAVIQALRRPPRFNLYHAGSSDLMNEQPLDMAPTSTQYNLLLDTTPVAKRVVRAIPRPLSISRSERGFDKRQLLSGLLITHPEPAASAPPEMCTATFTDTPITYSESIDNAVVRGTSNELVEECQQNETQSTADEPIDLCSGVNTDTQPETQNTNHIDDTDLDLELSNMDMDSLMEGLDTLEDDMDPMDGIEELLLEVEDTEQTQSKSASSTGEARSGNPFKNYERCLTLFVSDGWYTKSQLNVSPDSHDARPQKIAIVLTHKEQRQRHIYLRDEWLSTPISTGDVLNIVGDIPEIDSEGSVVFDSRTENLLPILRPDTLISATHLSDLFSCRRRAVLRDRVREISDGSPPTSVMLVGHLLHDLFQSCALENKWDDVTMAKKINSIIADNVDRLWECQVNEDTIHAQLVEVMPTFQDWAARYLHRSAANGSTYISPATTGLKGGAASDNNTVAISKILNVEENIWSPKFGLNGKVDLTILAQFAAHGAKAIPFELKTGRSTQNIAHRTQLLLYTLMLSDRYDVDIDLGLLYYPRAGELIQVQRIAAELRAIIAARNTMTEYMKGRSGNQLVLPDMLGNEHTCKYCSHRPKCFIFHRALENGSEKTARVSPLMWQTQVNHLSAHHLEFVRQWMKMIDKEESDMLRFREELWTMSSHYREQSNGRCLSNMRILVDSVEKASSADSFNRYKMTFAPVDGSLRRPLLDGQISVGDPITVSTECGQYALAVGYVSALEHSQIVLALDRPVRGVPKQAPGFDPQTNQDFESFVEIRQRGPSVADEETIIHPDIPASTANDVFRIDQDEMSSGMSRIRANVMRMFVAQGGNEKWRRLIVDLDTPTFHPLHENIEAQVLKVQQEKCLNIGQAAALRKVLSANDYALVMGMPGAGKTTTIAELVNVLVSQKKTVLIASYTHVAVDNIMVKLQDLGIPLIRLGNRSKVHPRIVKHLPSEADLVTVSQIDRFFNSAPVVGTTCLGVSHPIFTMRKFDYCIIDEASQITLPVCIGPLLEASKFVLVGDHHQLPPLVRNTAARDEGLGVSLFKRLCEAHPSAVARLEYQYRMNSDIQRLANNLIYNGYLHCGTQEIANQRISYKVDPRTAINSWPFEIDKLNDHINMDWAVKALDPSRGAVFLNTDDINGKESRVEGADLVQNIAEIRIIKVLTKILQACGIEGRNVGILSPYRTQLKQLEIEFGIRREGHSQTSLDSPEAIEDGQSAGVRRLVQEYSGIEVHTIDRYQGRDADVIIISLVRSNSNQAIGDLLRDWRRINVAITRARFKLIIVGSRKTLTRSPLLGGMISILDTSDCVIGIPANADIPATTSAAISSSTSASSDVSTTPSLSKQGSSKSTAGSAMLKSRPIAANILSE
ncbi:DNA replication endonuclease-helicase Dna2 [Coemansia interrupta]|uniref:DNA replication ATP-dependent helicase/nuclease n=1 Tax=Coemansia interrupta TaxID=1126814 RepID=A0A9W8LFP3_9FUNG|nr:DNA replication endonuclease-helicase Dna2 [Coemansia interrupta]